MIISKSLAKNFCEIAVVKLSDNETQFNAIGEGNDGNSGNSYKKQLTIFFIQNNQKSKPQKEKQF
jgi:hypothetical protein